MIAAQDVADVEAYERQLLEPAVRADPDRASALLHPEFEEHGASGRVWDRETIVRSLAGAAADEEPVQVLHLRGQPLSTDVVLLTYRARTPSATSLRSSVWVRVEGRWLLRFHQGTPVPSTTPEP